MEKQCGKIKLDGCSTIPQSPSVPVARTRSRLSVPGERTDPGCLLLTPSYACQRSGAAIWLQSSRGDRHLSRRNCRCNAARLRTYSLDRTFCLSCDLGERSTCQSRPRRRPRRRQCDCPIRDYGQSQAGSVDLARCTLFGQRNSARCGQLAGRAGTGDDS